MTPWRENLVSCLKASLISKETNYKDIFILLSLLLDIQVLLI